MTRGRRVEQLFTAAKRNDAIAVRDLNCLGVNVMEKSKKSDRRTTLHKAALKGSHEVVKVFLAGGADVHCRDAVLASPLHCAVLSPHDSVKISEALIAAGADINGQDKHGRTPLHLAALDSSEELVESLVAAGASVKIYDYIGNSALHWAVRSREESEKKVGVLLAAGAIVNVKNRYGETPLHWAAVDSPEGVLARLILAGANVWERSHRDETPADVTERWDIAHFFRDLKWCERPGGGVSVEVQSEREETSRPLEEIAALLQARLLHVRGVGGKGVDRIFGERASEGLLGLPQLAWGNMLDILRAFKLPSATGHQAPCLSDESIQYDTVSPSFADLSVFVPHVCAVIEEAKAALSGLVGAKQEMCSFRNLQKTFSEKVRYANSEWVVSGGKQFDREPLPPVAGEEARDRDCQRKKTVMSVESALKRGRKAVGDVLRECPCVGVGKNSDSEVGGNMGRDVHASSLFIDELFLIDRLEASLRGLAKFDETRGGMGG
uniref:Uncharacterized protein n=1 Tax=Chromera velia CCMP2878 TaxID=1169474 RepID=A0A0G4H8T1_9ALVE|eukprot:Cvel_25253.t1-p1 / transcript=Cvel_25253.t1 / gene=Cvel_25253 / organism=Chromera_velia_CCMP2878 / gene_product=Serine/threonine-protein phosphatase 6 regulatory, putative / transcript_product=Serine/threonine-protein phosphatase 6 regulatory, putative / location=Cvel_scaffold2834:7824-9305(+) / protein_length=494 / sequence_SO=supercontig / SO=protein_coding / is_pseudo=false